MLEYITETQRREERMKRKIKEHKREAFEEFNKTAGELDGIWNKEERTMKEKIEAILAASGVAFTGSLADKIIDLITEENKRLVERIKEESTTRNILGDNFIHITTQHLDDIAQEITGKDNGLFYCPVCGKKAAVWQADFDMEDCGDYEGTGIVATYECSNCGAELEAIQRES